MAKKPDITTIASGYYSRQALNSNFQNLKDGFDNTLSLDGSTPNFMQADLDLNGYSIANAGDIIVNGQPVISLLNNSVASIASSEAQAIASSNAAANSANAAANSATAAAADEVSSATNAASAATSWGYISPYTAEIQILADDLIDGSFVAGDIYDFGSITTPTTGTSGSPDGFIVTVYNNLADITTVAGISADITTFAGLSADISSVAAIDTDVTTVAGNTADISTVASISVNVTSVAGNAANIAAIGPIASDITSVASISADVTLVAADISDVSTVATDIANVNTVATNMADVNNFGETYRIGTTEPTTSLDVGDLFFNSTIGVLKVYDGTGWTAGVTAGSGFLALTGGNLTGPLLTTSTIAGRDIATDGTKLDGIEDAATNYSDAEVDTHLNTTTATTGQYLGWNGTDYAWSTVDLSTKLDLAGGTLTGTLNGTSAVFSADVAAANFNTTSDKNLKTNVETIKAPVETVQQLRGVTFDWIGNGVSDLGVIAQEVEEVLPELVKTSDDGFKSVKYSNMVGLLIEAVKDQQVQIDELKAKLGVQ